MVQNLKLAGFFWVNPSNLWNLNSWDLEIQDKLWNSKLISTIPTIVEEQRLFSENCFIIFLEGHPRGLMGSLDSSCQAAMPTLRAPLTLTRDWTNEWKKRKKDCWANAREIRGRRRRFHESKEETIRRVKEWKNASGGCMCKGSLGRIHLPMWAECRCGVCVRFALCSVNVTIRQSHLLNCATQD